MVSVVAGSRYPHNHRGLSLPSWLSLLPPPSIYIVLQRPAAHVPWILSLCAFLDEEFSWIYNGPSYFWPLLKKFLLFLSVALPYDYCWVCVFVFTGSRMTSDVTAAVIESPLTSRKPTTSCSSVSLSRRVCPLLQQSLRMPLLNNPVVWSLKRRLILVSCSRSATLLSEDVILFSFSSFCLLSDWTSFPNFMIICWAAIIEMSADIKWRYFLISSPSLLASLLLLPEEARSGFPTSMEIGAD